MGDNGDVGDMVGGEGMGKDKKEITERIYIGGRSRRAERAKKEER